MIEIMAKVATIEPRSNDFCKVPIREKCWKAKYAAITSEIIAPSCLPLPMEHIETTKKIINNGQGWSQTMHLPTLCS